MIEITNINRVGNYIEITVKGLEKIFRYGLEFLRDKNHLVELLKLQVENELHQRSIENECNKKYNTWVIDMVGETIA